MSEVGRCRHCKEEIRPGAVVCPHCQRHQGWLQSKEGLVTIWAAIATVLLALQSFVTLMPRRPKATILVSSAADGLIARLSTDSVIYSSGTGPLYSFRRAKREGLAGEWLDRAVIEPGISAERSPVIYQDRRLGLTMALPPLSSLWTGFLSPTERAALESLLAEEDTIHVSAVNVCLSNSTGRRTDSLLLVFEQRAPIAFAAVGGESPGRVSYTPSGGLHFEVAGLPPRASMTVSMVFSDWPLNSRLAARRAFSGMMVQMREPSVPQRQLLRVYEGVRQVDLRSSGDCRVGS